jgi:hypothetical protein
LDEGLGRLLLISRSLLLGSLLLLLLELLALFSLLLEAIIPLPALALLCSGLSVRVSAVVRIMGMEK